jgi:Glycosyl transferase family 2
MSGQIQALSESAAPSVSVVIPTLLRDQLPRAIASVRAQAYPGTIQVVVVIDLPADDSIVAQRLESGIDADVVVTTGGRAGGGAARNLGIHNSTGELIAFLDDDDEWLPTKLWSQYLMYRDHPNRESLVIATRVVHKVPQSRSIVRRIPAVLISPGDRVEVYLFRRRRPSVRRAVLYTSTLLAPANLVRSIDWTEGLVRHQDWDWLIKLQSGGATFACLEQDLAVIWLNSPSSISASSDWAASLQWGLAASSGWDRQTLADFLAAQSLRYACQARSVPGIVRSIQAIVNTRRLPHWGSLLMAFGGVLPRRRVANALMALSRIATRKAGVHDVDAS